MPTVFAGSASYPCPSPGPVVTIGNFDGVHLGHRWLIDRVVARAAELGVHSCVYTFEPAPQVVLAPHQHRPRIMTWPDKIDLLHAAGVEHVVVERFSHAFSLHPPEWFAREILGRRLRPTALCLGYDFRFGRGRAGTTEGLRTLLPDVPVEQVEAFELEGQVVSSSAIRGLVAAGEVERAHQLLGRPYYVRGTVVPGDQRGRQIGHPTANLQLDAQLVPANGVYAVRAQADRGEWRDGVANLGTRPTFDGHRFLVEVHLLDAPGIDLYGTELSVAFVARLRPELRFDGPEALRAQIRRDVDAARVVLADLP